MNRIKATILMLVLSCLPISLMAVCTPTSALLCAAADDQADIYINGVYVDTFPYVPWDQAGVYPKCVTVSTALLQPAGNVIAVQDLNTGCCEIWTSWSLDITCSGGAHSYDSSSDGSPITMFYDAAATCPATTPTPNAGLQWTDPLYTENAAWTAPVQDVGYKYGKRLWDPQTGNLLPAMGYSPNSPGGVSDCKQIFFRQGFDLIIAPTPMPPAFTISKSASQTTNITGPGLMTFTVHVCNTGGGTFGNTVQIADSWNNTEWNYSGPFNITDNIQGQIDQVSSSSQLSTWVFQGGVQGGTCYDLVYNLQDYTTADYCISWSNNCELDYQAAPIAYSTVTVSDYCPAAPAWTVALSVSPTTVVNMNSTYYFNIQFCNSGGAAWDPTKPLTIVDDYSGTGTDDWQFQGPFYIGSPVPGIAGIIGSFSAKTVSYTVTFTNPGFTGCYTVPIQMLKTNNGTINACTWNNIGSLYYQASPVIVSTVGMTGNCSTPTCTPMATNTVTSVAGTPSNTPVFAGTSTPTFTVTPTLTCLCTLTSTMTPTPSFTRTKTPLPVSYTQTPTFTPSFTITQTTLQSTPVNTPTSTPFGSFIRNLAVLPGTVAPGQNVTVTFEYMSNMTGCKTAYFAALSNQCAIQNAGTAGQAVLVSEAGMNTPATMVNGGRINGVNNDTAWHPSSEQDANIYMTVPVGWAPGTYYAIVAVRDCDVYLNPLPDVDNQMCAVFTVALAGTATLTWTPTPATPTPTFTITITGTPTVTGTPTSTITATAIMPTALPTATITASPGCVLPVIGVNLVYDPAKDYVLINITSSASLAGPPAVRVVPHGNSDNKPVFDYTAALVSAGPPSVYYVQYPKKNAWGDIDSVFVSGADACNNTFTTNGAYTKTVNTLKDVQLFKSVICPEKGERCRLVFTCYGGDKVKVKVYSKNGSFICSLYENDHTVPGRQEVAWGGKNDKGENVVSGMYIISIDAGSYKTTCKVAVIH